MRYKAAVGARDARVAKNEVGDRGRRVAECGRVVVAGHSVYGAIGSLDV